MLWYMSSSEWVVSFGFICCFTYIIGWLSDGILKTTGFGHIGNWLILLAGAYTAIYCFNIYGYHIEWYPLFTLSVVSGITCGMFITMCIFKRVLG